jgi:hypothetical protein
MVCRHFPRKGQYETSAAYSDRVGDAQQYYAISLNNGRNGCDSIYRTAYVADSGAWHLEPYVFEAAGDVRSDVELGAFQVYDVDCLRSTTGTKSGTTAAGATVTYAIQHESHFGLLWVEKSPYAHYQAVIPIPAESAASTVPKIRVIAIVRPGIERQFGLLLTTKDWDPATFSFPVERHRVNTYVAVDEMRIVIYNSATGAIYSDETLSKPLADAQ